MFTLFHFSGRVEEVLHTYILYIHPVIHNVHAHANHMNNSASVIIQSFRRACVHVQYACNSEDDSCRTADHVLRTTLLNDMHVCALKAAYSPVS